MLALHHKSIVTAVRVKKEKWLLVITSHVPMNGSIFHVLGWNLNPKEPGFAQAARCNAISKQFYCKILYI